MVRGLIINLFKFSLNYFNLEILHKFGVWSVGFWFEEINHELIKSAFDIYDNIDNIYDALNKNVSGRRLEFYKNS